MHRWVANGEALFGFQRVRKRSQLIRQTSNQEIYDRAVDAPNPVSLISRFHDDTGDVPPIKFETGHQGKEAERLTRFVWNQVIQLLLAGKELEANSLGSI